MKIPSKREILVAAAVPPNASKSPINAAIALFYEPIYIIIITI